MPAENAVTAGRVSGGGADPGGHGPAECKHLALHMELGTPKEQSGCLEEGVRILPRAVLGSGGLGR